MRVAVVGHVEWVTHVRGSVPPVGQIAHLDDVLDEPAGGGGVTAAQVARLAGGCLFFTALAGDAFGVASREVLSGVGVSVLAGERPGRQTRALSVADPSGERTILVAGERLSPTVDDPLPWADLAGCAAAFFTGDDPRSLVAARAAGCLVVTARRLAALVESGVRADVVVASATDEDERVDPAGLPVAPGAFVFTDGARGGSIVVGGRERRFAPVPAAHAVDTYGAGDSFAGGLTVGLALGLGLDGAAELGARCGAAALAGRGGLSSQLDAAGAGLA